MAMAAIRCRKIHLVDQNNHHLHAAAAAVDVVVQPWGVQVSMQLDFEGSRSDDRWTLVYPITMNLSVLEVRAMGAMTSRLPELHKSPRPRFNRAPTQNGPDAHSYATVGRFMTWPGLVPTAQAFSLLIVTTQPVSYKNVFLEWLMLGVPSRSCRTQIRVDTSGIADQNPQVRLEVMDNDFLGERPAAIMQSTCLATDGTSHAWKTRVLLSQLRNLRIAVELRLHPDMHGYGPQAPVHVRGSGGILELRPAKPYAEGSWDIRPHSFDTSSSRAMAVYKVSRASPDSVKTDTPRFLWSVAALVAQITGKTELTKIPPITATCTPHRPPAGTVVDDDEVWLLPSPPPLCSELPPPLCQVSNLNVRFGLRSRAGIPGGRRNAVPNPLTDCRKLNDEHYLQSAYQTGLRVVDFLGL